MMEWFKKFWEAHGDRCTFGGAALLFAVSFSFAGSEELKGTGHAILIGLAMLCFNKARGTAAKKPTDEIKE